MPQHALKATVQPWWMPSSRCYPGSKLCRERALSDAVMPVETVGFHLKPVGFFKQNPALDLPRTVNTASQLASQCCGVLSADGQTGHANGHTNGYANGHANGHAALLAEPRVATAEE